MKIDENDKDELLFLQLSANSKLDYIKASLCWTTPEIESNISFCQCKNVFAEKMVRNFALEWRNHKTRPHLVFCMKLSWIVNIASRFSILHVCTYMYVYNITYSFPIILSC